MANSCSGVFYAAAEHAKPGHSSVTSFKPVKVWVTNCNQV